ncbi:hypothetical protein SPRG_16332 [Saprolegnia parasitica CBS 223.65]|uniref:DUF6604 domain-containing protein n=1 Tax=Saprolegnia parasitica (strain CBS 223.65) TaxID=695850 RepID=A0A067BIM5_SAPPC|nr:hypothetical protein SPRG_16332 [Saprolegnia parasitica CBS 223.65]KDO18229.1 hypothetical protein SPRG_16332 [Saprolegnia parasitica CBS 223.65]|eukprot:XP_012211062.1 hypothetical protein SPRG_16332 [Saprolegnia parasitica CBS 223.65]
MIWAAAIKVADKAMPVPASIMRQLTRSIRLRWLASEAVAAPDEGHVHFLDLLRAIKAKLEPLVEVRQPSTAAPVVDATNLSNTFGALSVEDDEDDTDAPDMPAFDVAAFVPPVEPTRAEATRAKLLARIEAEKFRAWCFVSDMDELMGEVKAVWRAFKQGDTTLVAATAVTNACVKLVGTLSSELQVEHPYLKSLDEIAVLLGDHGMLEPVTLQYNVPLERVVEVIVLSRRAAVPRKYDDTCRVVMQKLKVSFSEADSVLQSVMRIDVVNRGSALFYTNHLDEDEDDANDDLLDLHLLLVGLLDAIQPGTRLICRDGFFGPTWDEAVASAPTRKALFQTLMADVLPPLLHQVLDERAFKIDHQDDFMPFHKLVKEYETTQVVTLPFVFAAQCLLESILAVQGPSSETVTVASVGAYATDVMRRVLQHLLTFKTKPGELYSPPHTTRNLDITTAWLGNTLRIATTYPGFSEKEVARAWLNPWMAGQHVLMTTMTLGLDTGIYLLDDIGQGRLVLHLYNALRCRDRIAHIPVLEMLADLFEQGKSVWAGSRPNAPGGFLKAHLIAWGYEAKDAPVVDARTAHRDSKDRRSKFQKAHAKMQRKGRTLNVTEPEHLSRAYRLATYMEAPAMRNEKLPAMHDLRRTMDAEWAHYLHLDFGAIGLLFREIWSKLVHALGFSGVGPQFPQFDPDWRETQENNQIHNENLCLQTLLFQCDEVPESPKLAVAAEILASYATRLETDALVAPA